MLALVAVEISGSENPKDLGKGIYFKRAFSTWWRLTLKFLFTSGVSETEADFKVSLRCLDCAILLSSLKKFNLPLWTVTETCNLHQIRIGEMRSNALLHRTVHTNN